MRVLCLHGMGTNASIFETQTEIFRGLLPKHFSYEFVDAECDCLAADGVEEIFPGPYSCYYPVPTISNVEGAHEYVWDIINEEGPFDAVMGFSQGAALAASILLRHQLEHPFEAAPFRLAIFICGSFPYCIESDHGVDVAGLFATSSSTGFGPPTYIKYDPLKDDGSAEARPISIPARARAKEISEEPLIGFNMSTMNVEQWAQLPIAPVMEPTFDSDAEPASESDQETIFSPSQSNGTLSPASSGYDSDQNPLDVEKYEKGASKALDHVIRHFHPAVDKLRISIPTAHIYGATDPYYRQSLELAGLCDPRWTSRFEHSNGHIVPRGNGINAKIAATIEKAVQMSEICGG